MGAVVLVDRRHSLLDLEIAAAVLQKIAGHEGEQLLGQKIRQLHLVQPTERELPDDPVK